MVDASLDGWLTTGRFNAAFEERLAKYLGVKHLITVNSGSSANLVAFSTLTSPRLGDARHRAGRRSHRRGRGFPDHRQPDPAVRRGAGVRRRRPGHAQHRRLARSRPRSRRRPRRSCWRTAWATRSISTSSPRCAGSTACGWSRTAATRSARRTTASWSGTFGDIGTLSFYPAHHITMGEGGAVFTNNPELKLIAESFRDWGRDCYCAPGKDNTCGKRFCWKLGDLPEGYDHKYTYSHLGYNLKITDMQAACALAQMDRLDDFIAARKANFAYLKERLASRAQIPAPARGDAEVRAVVVRLSRWCSRTERASSESTCSNYPRPEQDRHAPAVRRQPHAPAVHDRAQFPRQRRPAQHRHRDESDVLAGRVSWVVARDAGLHRGSLGEFFWR